MNKRLVIILIALVLLVMFLAAFKTVAPKAIEPIVFYSETATEVVGYKPEAPAQWLLVEGEYTVIFNDGTSSVIKVENGAWRYIQ